MTSYTYQELSHLSLHVHISPTIQNLALSSGQVLKVKAKSQIKRLTKGYAITI